MSEVTTIPEVAVSEPFQSTEVLAVSTAHGVHDTYSAFLPVLLPVLIEKFTLTNTTAGLLSVVLQLPSLLQPFIGYLADRANLRLLIILTPAITGAAMSSLGIAPNYAFLVFLLAVTGLSSASLHAIGPVVVSALSGERLGKGMSFWMVGGELGRSLGPLIAVTALTYLAFEGMPWLMLGGILISFFLNQKLNSISTQSKLEVESFQLNNSLKKVGKVMLPLTAILFTRSMMVASLTIYLPTFLASEGASLWMAGISLTVLQASGVVGALFAGVLSDKFGRRKMLSVSYLAAPIFMVLFLLLQANAFIKIPLLVLIGFFAISVTPVIMAIVLESFPDDRSFANGVYMAISFILSAFATLSVGAISDWLNLRSTFLISAGLVFLGLPFIQLLPNPIRGK